MITASRWKTRTIITSCLHYLPPPPLTQLKAREAQEAREAEAAQAAAAAAHQSALAAARKSSRKGGGAAAAKQAAEISWYGCPKLIERDELQYPPVPPPFAGGDGNADRDGSGRRAGRLYSQVRRGSCVRSDVERFMRLVFRSCTF